MTFSYGLKDGTLRHVIGSHKKRNSAGARPCSQCSMAREPSPETRYFLQG